MMAVDSEREAHREAIIVEAKALIGKNGGPDNIGTASPLRPLADEVKAMADYDARHPLGAGV
jgi:hypothetical protein